MYSLSAAVEDVPGARRGELALNVQHQILRDGDDTPTLHLQKLFINLMGTRWRLFISHKLEVLDVSKKIYAARKSYVLLAELLEEVSTNGLLLHNVLISMLCV